ncbi:hypothetical protein ACFXTI_003739 [Malus domestica]
MSELDHGKRSDRGNELDRWRGLGREACMHWPSLSATQLWSVVVQHKLGLVTAKWHEFGLALLCGVGLRVLGYCYWRLGLRLPLAWAAEVAASWAASMAFASWAIAWWPHYHRVGPFPTATVVLVAAMVVVLRGGKVAHLAIALSLVDRRGGHTSRPSSFDPDL